MPLSEHGLKWANGVISTERDAGLSDVVAQHYEKRAMSVLDTHGASILKVAKTALEALDPQNSAAEMRHVVKNCRMRLDVLMVEANAAARALAESDAADDA